MQIKFLTLNILHGGYMWDNLIDFINREKPDIACFQEVYDGYGEDLEKRFKTMDEFRREFEWFSDSVFEPTILDTSTNIKWGNSVFSRFEILEHKNYFFDKPFSEYNFELDKDPREVPQAILETKIKLNEKEIYVYSWHGVWDVHGEDTQERDKMGKIIIDAIRGKSPVILAGDTNFKPHTKVAKRIEKELNLESVFGESLESTFNMKHKSKPGYASSSVDMIFVSKDFKVIDKYMPMDDVSDHRPLVTAFEL